MPKSKPDALLSQTAWNELKHLPGNTRRQMITAIDSLENNPRPPQSKRLDIEGELREVRR